MKTAKISTPYSVKIIPTEMTYTLCQDMFEVEGQKVCEIQYQLFTSKWIKTQTTTEDETVITQDVEIDFTTPILFDTGKKVIPFGLYLLFEQYRATKDSEVLAQINMALTQFQFEHSLADFVLQVSSID